MTSQNRSGILAAIVIVSVCCVLVFLVDGVTRERIEKNRSMVLQNRIQTVTDMQIDIHSDFSEITIPTYFGTENRIRLYYTRSNDQVTGVVFSPVKARGYNGIITLDVGVTSDGEVSGVRIIEHEETEEIGDNVHQEKSDWVLQFDGLSLQKIPASEWSVVKDGGKIDQYTGATITSRSIIAAVKHIIEYHEYNQDEIY